MNFSSRIHESNKFFKGSQMVLTIMARTSKIVPRSSRCPLGECHQMSPSLCAKIRGANFTKRLPGEKWGAKFTTPLSLW